MVSATVDSTHGAYLTDVSARDIDMTVRVRSDRLPSSGAFLFAYLAGRRGSSGDGIEYDGRVILNAAGDVSVDAGKRLRVSDPTDPNHTRFVSQFVQFGTAGGALSTYVPGTWIRVRMQIQNVSSPTTARLRLRAWQDGQAEPGTWQYTATDSEPALQGWGEVGLRTYVSTGNTMLPVTFSFDDLQVKSIGTPPATPTATPVPPTATPPPAGTPTPTPGPGRYRSAVLADNPVAYWRLGESSGATAADERIAHPGSYVGSPTLGAAGALTGDPNTVVRLNGSNQYVNVPDAGAFSSEAGASGKLSLEAWVNVTSLPTSASQFGTVISKGSGSGYEYALRVKSDGLIELILWSPGGSTYQSVATAAGMVATGTWYHLVGTCDNGVACRIYVNGVERGTRTTGWGTKVPGDTSSVLSIGRRGDNVQYLAATIDEVAVYNTVLSSSAVLAHFSAGR
jgi:hypothetical protein